MSINIGDLKIESSAFGPHGEIPARYTGEGEDVSPEVRWSGVPDGTRQLERFAEGPVREVVGGALERRLDELLGA